MKLAVVIFTAAIISSSATISSNPLFGSRHYPYEPFGVDKAVLTNGNGGDDIRAVKLAGKKTEEPEEVEAADDQEDEYETAQDKIFHAVEAAEEAVVHAVEEEVETLFHELPHDEKEPKEPKEIDPLVEEALHAMEDGDME